MLSELRIIPVSQRLRGVPPQKICVSLQFINSPSPVWPGTTLFPFQRFYTNFKRRGSQPGETRNICAISFIFSPVIRQSRRGSALCKTAKKYVGHCMINRPVKRKNTLTLYRWLSLTVSKITVEIQHGWFLLIVSTVYEYYKLVTKQYCECFPLVFPMLQSISPPFENDEIYTQVLTIGL